MPVSSSLPRPFVGALSLVLVGAVVLAVAFFVPANLRSLSPVLLEVAGRRTPSVAEFGLQLVDAEKLGSARLVLAAAQAVKDPKAPDLARDLEQLGARAPELVAWGGWDPFLDPLFNLRENRGRHESTPVLQFFVAGPAREALRRYLGNSRSLGVQAVLATREIDRTTQFIPALRAGGQPLEATILLTALLYQGEHLSGPLQREIRRLAETASQAKELGDLENFYLDLLALGKRLDWVALTELLRRTQTVRTVAEYAQLAKLAGDELPLIYTAALFSDSADPAASYLIRYGRAGVEDLRTAVASGRGAVRLLLERQVPVNDSGSPVVGPVAMFGLLHPTIALVAKYACFLLGTFLVLRGLSMWLFPRPRDGGLRLPRIQSTVLAGFFAVLLVVGTEPFLLQAAPPSEFQFRLVLPALAASAPDAPPPPPSSPATMDSRTLLSIGLFASLQVLMYVICLLKLADIDRQPVSAQLKLRLVENEENLFDGGLYIGIAGTATALVLQVLRLIDPNLLAAYSSNLFGIICVALVKIYHVRTFKRRLIIEAQTLGTEATARPAAAPVA